MIKDNIESINKEIAQAAASGKYGREVTLIAVSKTKPAEDIREAYEAGIRDFGENKAQELCSKYDLLPSDIRWHLIGHLQTNKVKSIIDKVYLIHSVDSLHLAREIEKQAEKAGISVNILIEVNISGEESKFGVTKEELPELLRAIAPMPHISVLGLMTVAPETEDMALCRQVFSGLRKLSIDIESLKIDNIQMKMLSMGMSGDFTAAIQEGATMVRIGSRIFGKRDYNLQ